MKVREDPLPMDLVVKGAAMTPAGFAAASAKAISARKRSQSPRAIVMAVRDSRSSVGTLARREPGEYRASGTRSVAVWRPKRIRAERGSRFIGSFVNIFLTSAFMRQRPPVLEALVQQRPAG